MACGREFFGDVYMLSCGGAWFGEAPFWRIQLPETELDDTFGEELQPRKGILWRCDNAESATALNSRFSIPYRCLTLVFTYLTVKILL